MKKFIIWGISISLILGIGIYFLIDDSNKKHIDQKIDTNEVIDKNIVINQKTEGFESKDLSETIIKISNISEANKGDTVKIKGKITKMNISGNKDVFLDIDDSSGSILVPIFKNKNIDTSLLKENLEIEVSGKVDIYKEKLEIIPSEESDIKILNDNKDDILNNKKYSEEIIDSNKIGEIVLVEGDIISIFNHQDGHVFIYINTNGNEKLNIPIFNNIGYNSSELSVGKNVSIKGKVKEYKNQIQVIPENKEEIKIN